jgi:peptide-methionine (R)-S-oxide reductase
MQLVLENFAEPEQETTWGKIGAALTRRRALIITPFAFAGIYALSSRKGKTDGSTAGAAAEEVDIVQFDDAGQRLGLARVKRVVKSDSEWRKLLTPEQYYVTRRENTDTPFTGTYYKMHDPGLFRCVCCANAVFSSETKFDSGTGWPSFWEPIARENVGERRDTSMFMERVEVHCNLCLAHLGHVFDDGPQPTGLRYCLDESSLRFIPKRG